MLSSRYKNVLITLAKRNGSKYNSDWYGEYWSNLFGPGISEAYWTCFICNEKIFSCPLYAVQHGKYLIEDAAEKHGLQHLKEKSLLIFM